MSELELKNPCDICFLKDNDCIQDKVKVCLLQKQYQSDPEVVDKLQEQIGLEQLHATSLISEIIQLKAELKETESEADKWLEYSKELVRRSNEKDAEITRLKEKKREMIEVFERDACDDYYKTLPEWQSFKAKYLKEIESNPQ
jgi:vacuolar-type H+-ATPase subunit I/STV1